MWALLGMSLVGCATAAAPPQPVIAFPMAACESPPVRVKPGDTARLIRDGDTLWMSMAAQRSRWGGWLRCGITSVALDEATKVHITENPRDEEAWQSEYIIVGPREACEAARGRMHESAPACRGPIYFVRELH
jgi:hypothetical protein